MRLTYLRIRNIASLKGEHEVNFLEIQKESPLFAITGETGAGKSTILNCIGLALYGKIYKSNVHQPDVVTLGEKEGSIELIFQVKGKFYLADWRIRVRKQNGEPYSTTPNATRVLYTIEGSYFNDSKTVANTDATALLNLDFDQFCKCIILNQGEFARFLTSSFNDRKDILEKLYPGELLDNISRELDQEKKTLEKEKHELELRLRELRGDNQSGESLKEEKEKLGLELSGLEKSSGHFEKLDFHFVSLFSYFEKYNDNEMKKIQIKDEMALETTRFNHLLKAGEEIFDTYESSKKKHEKEVPVLQTYLEKEGTLKLLEEGWANLRTKFTELTRNIETTQERIRQKESEEREVSLRVKTLSSEIKHPIEVLTSTKDNFQELFDLFNEKELLTEEIKGKKEKLSELETRGLELTKELETLDATIKLLPPDAPLLENEIQKKKSDLQLRADKKQRSLIASEEMTKQVQASKALIQNLEEKISSLNFLINKTIEDVFPLETTLKLQEVLNATEVCVDHALASGKDSCPVCEAEIPQSKWSSLKKKIASTDLKTIRQKFEEGNQLLLKSKQEVEIYQGNIRKEQESIKLKEQELESHIELTKEEIPSLAELDKELDSIRKQALELNQRKKENETKIAERNNLRQQFKTIRHELTIREEAFSAKQDKLSFLSEKLRTIIPVVNRDTIRDLKNLSRLLDNYLKEDALLQNITREKSFLLEKKNDSSRELEVLKKTDQEQTKRISEIKNELEKELKGEKASVLIQKINDLVKLTSDLWSKHLDEQNKAEQNLKGIQGKLYSYEELTKSFDLQYTKELHTVRELGNYSSERADTNSLLEKIKNLELDFTSPKELFIPIRDFIKNEKEHFKNAANECRMKFASVAEKLSAWEKLQDKIQLLEIKARDINVQLDRKMRLFEVIGKDELRTFVLSLVEENLIHQTNEELQKLCQGRYEIIHQTRSFKMTPEFFILDKFREGGKRKVSTLSGGETFMVSLAMALGLAEMTRGQAEIDSLFIDEGFGTLDQDSLEDVLDMLQQIQTRGLMVGIISHIKTLTSAIPINLVLTKKQDGTSSVSLLRN